MPNENLPTDQAFSEETVEETSEVTEEAAEQAEESTEEVQPSEEVEEQEEEVIEFVLSDNQKQNEIGKALNQSKFQYLVMDAYPDYAVVYNLEDDKVYKVNYVVENDVVTITGNMEELFAEWVTKSEKEVLNNLRSRTESGTFESAIADYEKNIEDLQTEVSNKNDELSTLNIDKEQLSEKITSLEGQVDEFTQKIETLENYKKDVEDHKKNAIIAKYSVKLSDEILNTYREKVNEFTIDDLEKELAYELVKNDSTIFSTGSSEEELLPIESPLSGLEALISKYKK